MFAFFFFQFVILHCLRFLFYFLIFILSRVFAILNTTNLDPMLQLIPSTLDGGPSWTSSTLNRLTGEQSQDDLQQDIKPCFSSSPSPSSIFFVYNLWFAGPPSERPEDA